MREGELGAGDPIEVLSRPEHGVTVALTSRDAILLDEALLERAASAPELPRRARGVDARARRVANVNAAG